MRDKASVTGMRVLCPHDPVPFSVSEPPCPKRTGALARSGTVTVLRPCLESQCPNLTDRTRCAHHQRALNQRTWHGKSERYNSDPLCRG